ncbi:MAG: hypothetical protein NT076_02770 [Candidatus Pacearchaeota archaeon]|nr:hypothetical protein [Candidatus Pacearchaeota archaeon]
MDIKKIIERREKLEARFKVSGLADACVDVVKRLGKDRGSRRGAYYTWTNRLYEGGELVIDCSIGQNCQGDGRLSVSYKGKLVLELDSTSSSRREREREELPNIPISCVNHRMAVYIRGPWERKILDLAKSI